MVISSIQKGLLHFSQWEDVRGNCAVWGSQAAVCGIGVSLNSPGTDLQRWSMPWIQRWQIDRWRSVSGSISHRGCLTTCSSVVSWI